MGVPGKDDMVPGGDDAVPGRDDAVYIPSPVNGR